MAPSMAPIMAPIVKPRAEATDWRGLIVLVSGSRFDGVQFVPW